MRSIFAFLVTPGRRAAVVPEPEPEPVEASEGALYLRAWQGWAYHNSRGRADTREYTVPEAPNHVVPAGLYGDADMARQADGRQVLMLVHPHNKLWSHKDDRLRTADGSAVAATQEPPEGFRPQSYTFRDASTAYGSVSLLPLRGMVEFREEVQRWVDQELAAGREIDFGSMDGETPIGTYRYKSTEQQRAWEEYGFDVRIRPLISRHLQVATGDAGAVFYFENEPARPANYPYTNSQIEDAIDSFCHEVYGFAMWWAFGPVREAWPDKVRPIANCEQGGQEKGWLTPWLYTDDQPMFLGMGYALDLTHLLPGGSGHTGIPELDPPSGMDAATLPARFGFRVPEAEEKATEDGTIPSASLYGGGAGVEAPNGMGGTVKFARELGAMVEAQYGRLKVLATCWLTGPNIKYDAWRTFHLTQPRNVSYFQPADQPIEVYNKYGDSVMRMAMLTSGQYADSVVVPVLSFDSSTFSDEGGNNEGKLHLESLLAQVRAQTGDTLPRLPALNERPLANYNYDVRHFNDRLIRGQRIAWRGQHVPNHTGGPRTVYEVQVERLSLDHEILPAEYDALPEMAVGVFDATGALVDTITIPAGEVAALYTITGAAAEAIGAAGAAVSKVVRTSDGLEAGHVRDNLVFRILTGHEAAANLATSISDLTAWGFVASDAPPSAHPDGAEAYRREGTYTSPDLTGLAPGAEVCCSADFIRTSSSGRGRLIVMDSAGVVLDQTDSAGHASGAWSTKFVTVVVPADGVLRFKIWLKDDDSHAARFAVQAGASVPLAFAE